MKQQIAIGIVVAALAGGTGTGLLVRELRDDPATRDVSQTTPTKSTPTPTEKTREPEATKAPASSAPAATKAPAKPSLLPLSSLQITTGAVGPVSVGMTKDQAVATGYFDTDVPGGCEVPAPLAWKADYKNALDVITDNAGTIGTIGVSQPGPRTRSGLQVGSTYGEVRAVLGNQGTPQEAGYGQTGLFVNDGDGWIGFLFDTTVDQVQDGDVVTFIEVDRGGRPGLIRDGC